MEHLTQICKVETYFIFIFVNMLDNNILRDFRWWIYENVKDYIALL